MTPCCTRRPERSQDEIPVFRPALVARTRTISITRRATRAGYGPCTGACTCLISPRIRTAPLHRYSGAFAGAPARHAPSSQEEEGDESLFRQFRRL